MGDIGRLSRLESSFRWSKGKDTPVLRNFTSEAKITPTISTTPIYNQKQAMGLKSVCENERGRDCNVLYNASFISFSLSAGVNVIIIRR